MRIAIISVSDKTNLSALAIDLVERLNFCIYASDGSLAFLKSNTPAELHRHMDSVSSLSNYPSMLGGRVKTLHPAILGPILSRETDSAELEGYGWKQVSLVVCNLYPFEKNYQSAAANKRSISDLEKNENNIDDEEEEDRMTELIDIGGVTLLRASAKNWKQVTILSNPADYAQYQSFMKSGFEASEFAKFRRVMALKAFQMTSHYDNVINGYLMEKISAASETTLTAPIAAATTKSFLKLKYGINPHQAPAFIKTRDGSDLPFEVLGGNPGYINILDAMHAWPLVFDLKESFRGEVDAAASFKHCSPAGVSINSEPFTDAEVKAFHVNPAVEYSPIARAYIRARCCDPLSSFGDFVAVSGTVDLSLAKYLAAYVSDGIIAADYTEEALAKLNEKKAGSFLVLKWVPLNTSKSKIRDNREINGIVLSQPRNDFIFTKEIFSTTQHQRDAILAATTLKYTQR